MAIDPNIPLQVKSPDIMGNAKDYLSLARGALDYQTAKATQPATIQQANVAAQKAQFGLTQEQYQNANNFLNSIAQDPNVVAAAKEQDPTKRKELSQNIIAMLQEHRQNAIDSGTPEAMVDRAITPYLATAMLHPERVQQLIAQHQQAFIGPAGQVAQTQIPVSAQQAAAGTNIAGQPMAQFRDQFGNLQIGAMPTRQNVQMAPALGQPEAVSGVLKPVTQDWSETQSNAANASRNIGVLQNIKQLSKGAITGVTADRRQFVAGLAGLLGMSEQELEKTNTDLLAKNANMLAITGGNTDAARALAEGANPNTHMTPEAIRHAADQVISQQQLALRKQQFMQRHATIAATNPNDRGASYTNALSQWNQIADPRILQFKTMSPEERSAMKKSMSPAEQQDFVAKLRQAEKLGILK